MFIVIFLFLLAKNYAQGLNDRCVVHFDKPFYTTGETIWFKAYLPSKMNYNNSLIEVSVTNRTLKVVEKIWVETDDDLIDGYFKIPFDWETGKYEFSVLIKGKNSQQADLALDYSLSIYDDLNVTIPESTQNGMGYKSSIGLDSLKSEENPILEQTNEKENSIINGSEHHLISISLNESSYERRGLVTAAIEVNDQSGLPVKTSLSVSVTDGEFVARGFDSFAKGPLLEDWYEVDTKISVRGHAKYGGSNEREYSIGMSAFNQYEGVLDLFSTDLQGEFSFQMEPFVGERKVQFQDYYGREVGVSLANSSDNMEESDEVIYDKGIYKYLLLSKARKKVNQLFNPTELAQQVEKVTYTNVLEPSRSFLMTDYDEFDNIQDFFRNIVAPLKVKTIDGKYTYKMVNPEKKPFFPGTPLFIVDRHIVRDEDYIGQLDLNEVERIDLYYERIKLNELFGYFGRGGVVSVFTKEGSKALPTEMKKNIYEIQGVQQQLHFPEINYSDIDEHVPYFRPTIYWNPMVQTNEKGEATISFYHTDDRSTFQIEVLGVSKNGMLLQEKVLYKVPN